MISRSSSVPPVRPTFLPARSSTLSTAMSFDANAPEKKGAYAFENQMDFALPGFAPMEEITRSTLFVSRNGIRCFEVTGTSSSSTPRSFAISWATSTS